MSSTDSGSCKEGTLTTETVHISEAQKRQYQEGYAILERVIPDEHLQALRDECRRFIGEMHAEMDRAGTDTLGISHRNKRYFVAHVAARSPRIRVMPKIR